MDEGMGEVGELEEVSDLEEEIEYHASKYKYMTSSRWARMTPQEI